MYHTTAEQFDADVSDGNVLVDFYADWCGPCQQLNPTLESVNEADNDITVIKVDIEEEQDIANRFSVRSIPFLLYFTDGEIVHQDAGTVTQEEIESHFN